MGAAPYTARAVQVNPKTTSADTTNFGDRRSDKVCHPNHVHSDTRYGCRASAGSARVLWQRRPATAKTLALFAKLADPTRLDAKTRDALTSMPDTAIGSLSVLSIASTTTAQLGQTARATQAGTLSHDDFRAHDLSDPSKSTGAVARCGARLGHPRSRMTNYPAWCFDG